MEAQVFAGLGLPSSITQAQHLRKAALQNEDVRARALTEGCLWYQHDCPSEKQDKHDCHHCCKINHHGCCQGQCIKQCNAKFNNGEGPPTDELSITFHFESVEHTEVVLPTDLLSDVELLVLDNLGLDESTPDLYSFSFTGVEGTDLDETKTLAEIGIPSSGMIDLYVIEAPTVTPRWLNCMNGLEAMIEMGVSLKLYYAKMRIAPYLNIPAEDAPDYKVGLTPGIPLDEQQSFLELRISHGAFLYVWL
jgi:hypothetical protein